MGQQKRKVKFYGTNLFFRVVHCRRNCYCHFVTHQNRKKRKTNVFFDGRLASGTDCVYDFCWNDFIDFRNGHHNNKGYNENYCNCKKSFHKEREIEEVDDDQYFETYSFIQFYNFKRCFN